MNNETESNNPDQPQPPRLAVTPTEDSPPAAGWVDPHRDGRRPSRGTILGGVALGLFGTTIAGLIVAAIVGNVFQNGAAVLLVVLPVLGFLWFWSGWLTAAFARTKRARIGLALLFGLGYGIFPFAVVFAVCGGGF